MSNQKTVFVYNNETEPLCYIVKDGDYRHLDHVYINEYALNDVEDAKQLELSNLLYDEETGKEKFTSFSTFPTEEVLGGAFVITCGFLA